MSDASGRKTNQLIAIGFVGVIGIGILALLAAMMNRGTGQSGLPSRAVPVVDETIIADRTAAASPEMSWIVSSRAELERLSADLEEQGRQLEMSRKAAEVRAAEMQEEYDAQILQQAQKIAELEAKAAQIVTAPQSPATGPEQRLNAAVSQPERDILLNRPGVVQAPGPGTDFVERRPIPERLRTDRPDSDGNGNVVPASSGFGQKFVLTPLVEENTDTREVRTLANYLPAGSYVSAVVLSGADAATNVSSRENPIPVLFRITGAAITAGGATVSRAKVNLKDCIVQGSATGDLSSERVKVRLITMTCTNKRGEVLETRVSGFMSGSGKEGVRGQVVSREGPAVTNAAIAGTLAGLGSGLGAAGQAQLGLDESATTSSIFQGAGICEVNVWVPVEYAKLVRDIAWRIVDLSKRSLPFRGPRRNHGVEIDQAQRAVQRKRNIQNGMINTGISILGAGAIANAGSVNGIRNASTAVGAAGMAANGVRANGSREDGRALNEALALQERAANLERAKVGKGC
ncbi:TrbI/VirB10 family protein [uncultured Tateyamaria sp.]|uniref:TrbI/VirB10 family protein n=1 Tax=uncultured Tateyamaria sp. TaxID=455651 RepID=UPI0026346DB6|nr:TrbI/VirB10 family protein [uncultured Tateyamaria sp.]